MNDLILEDVYKWLLNTDYYIYQAKHDLAYYLYDTNGNYTADKKKISNLNIIISINDNDYYDIDIFSDYVLFGVFYPYEEQRYDISELEDICSTEESYFQYSTLKSPILSKTNMEYLIKIMNNLHD